MGSEPPGISGLVCPRDRASLSHSDGALVCSQGHRYPVVAGVPIMLMDEIPATLHVMRGSLSVGSGAHRDKLDPYYTETLGVSPEQREAILRASSRASAIDPVVNQLLAHTNGHMYDHLVGSLTTYPIPEIELPQGEGRRLLDMGCSWGRWCIAAARKGYKPIGIDPSLGAVFAARRVARQLNVEATFIVADARSLPFAPNAFDCVHSYSVLQHFSFDDAERAIAEASRVLRPHGLCKIQLANRYGVRCLYHQARRGFLEANGFEVRYWRPSSMRRTFASHFSSAELSPDCFFGLGLQKADANLMPPWKRLALQTSELLKAAARRLPPLLNAADSLFVSATKS
jgi:ubiquinone/menaquinone biosynthesis C-methylase UbiE/uncharacterized protein YbaR (Trm112 family)